MNLLPTEEQQQIVDTIRRFLDKEAPVSRFRAAKREIGNDDVTLWPKLAELGYLGLGLAESVGGIGLGVTDEVLLVHEYGKALISPAILSMMLGARVALAAGDETLAAEIVAGRTSVGMAQAREGATVGPGASGAFQLFDGAADYLLVVSEDGAALFPRSAFVGFESVVGTDSVVALERGSVKNVSPHLWLPAPAIHTHLTLLLAAYAVGIAEATRDMAVAYAGIREQFGKPIGSFQAIKHKCADMAMRAEAALCQSWFAAVVVEQGGDDAGFQAIASKLVAVDAARKNAAQNIQIHGAIGFTAEIDAHLYVKRVHLIDVLAGNQRRQRIRLLHEQAPA